jgi:hypothetical protein
MKTKYGGKIDSEELIDYFKKLTNQIYKCLPMHEANTPSLSLYIESLLIELGGAYRTIILSDDIFLKLLSNLEPLLTIEDHIKYRRQIFKCTNLCTKMIQKIMEKREEDLG